ncbi:branched-chain amino acid transport system carrier protein [Listeria fleischmannii 1991]|uniref:Branched-chain amino acid transport system carrier protein n=2 Tax=Listeria fleischmannii TaxID=1069827 RepID=A0A2X3HMM6_9LIST|nr:branched-chain amino acid transport system II carrier protein [Listeria fleischmannii]KMT58510.1 branched-chain amino acid transport system carrier protein [Listeria fleischmannii 1991]SQC72045.1 LIV-II [Listeria fleischmannii subsp. fleischmannii]
MNKSLSFSAYIFIGLMLFALFFGAGNLIFPAHLGQLAGTNVWIAITGFLLTGAGLPLLGVLAIGISGSNDLQSLANRVHPIYGVVFAVVLYLTIGPFFALPRTGTVSFEIGVAPFLGEGSHALALFIFTVIFFGVSMWLSLSPSKIVDRVGKFLTPALLIFIFILIIASLVKPLGEQTAPKGEYIASPFSTGFIDGYNTMDALASLVFGIIVINAIKSYGAKSKRDIAAACLKTGLIAVGFLAIIYIFVAYIGSMSVNRLGLFDNGGPILSGAASFYFGFWGKILLALIITLACLTTSIGLITACASYFQKLLPKMKYQTYVILFSAFACLVANVGLANLIKFSLPILMMIYPLTIVLILLTFLNPLFKGRRVVYVTTICVTAIISILEGAKAIKLPIDGIHTFFRGFIPFYDISMGWITFAIVGFIVGCILAIFTKPTTELIQNEINV